MHAPPEARASAGAQQMSMQLRRTPGVQRHSINKRQTHDKTGLLDLARKLCVLGQEAVARVDHVDLVLDGNLDNLIAGQVRADGRVLTALANLVGLVRLLAVHAETVLVAVDGHGVQGQLVGCPEDADGDLSSVGHWKRPVRGDPRSIEHAALVGLTHKLLELHDGAVRPQSVVDRVAVGVVLAMLFVVLALVDGRRRRRVLVDGQRGHVGRL